MFMLSVHKLESLGYSPVVTAWWWALLFQHNTCIWQTDEQTDKQQTDTARQQILLYAYVSRGKNS